MNIAKLKDLKQKLLERNTHNYSSVEIELEYDDNGVASILFENLGPLACKIIPLIEFKFTSTLSDDIFQVIIAELIDNPSILLIMDESMASGLYCHGRRLSQETPRKPKYGCRSSSRQRRNRRRPDIALSA